MRLYPAGTAAALALAVISAPCESQIVQAPPLTYADLTDLALEAPVAAHVRVKDSDRLGGEAAGNVPVGHTRFLVEAEIISLIRGAQGLPSRVSYLVDLPDENGRRARVRKNSEYILLASTVPGRAGELRLAAPDAQLPYSPDTADRLRSILTEASRAGAPAPVSGIGRAFHVPGSLPGESETQLFLLTADGRPISINILRRPGEAPRWGVSLAEVVTEEAVAPPRESLLWYRLACTLPRALPRQSLSDAEADTVDEIEADYRLVIEQLGPCDRNRDRR